MVADRPRTKILLDGGDPKETATVKAHLEILDGQTTNPTYVAKSPDVAKRIATGRRFTAEQQLAAYRQIVRQVSPLVGDAGVSIEVFADLHTSAEEMLTQGEEMFSWIPNAYIKYPCLPEGMRAAQMSVTRGIRVNMTLCFSQEQAAAVYAATLGAHDPVYISPFVGRLDDRGENGMDLVWNIKKMYAHGDGHVHVLAASLRKLDHLLCAFSIGSELATAPAKLLLRWADAGMPQPDASFSYQAVDNNGKQLKPIPYKDLDLNASWDSFDIRHELTTKGIERFVADYRNTLQLAA
ncbi:MAG TPA: transaldolase family protein [Terriglobales bacterium]|nr:transaldolase family protein [Terriglobales bacterium]